MKRTPLLLFLLAALPAAALADDRLQQAESELKSQGFYYGEVDGKSSAELNAAVRRYQIRNGLEVTGDLTAETLKSLGLGGSGSTHATRPGPGPNQLPPAEPPPPTRFPQPQQLQPQNEPPAPAQSPSKTQPPVNLRRDETNEDSDRRILRQEISRTDHDPSVVRPPASLDFPPTASNGRPDPVYSDLFAGSPYAMAPAPVQQEAARRAQRVLMERGYFRMPSDGSQGPALEEAILSYQHSRRLRLSGKLDSDTLAAMHLMPGSIQGNPSTQPFYGPGHGAKPQTYRGVWVE